MLSVKNWRIVAVLFSFKLTITLVVESTWICFTLQILSEWKNSNVKSSLLVNCSVKLVKKKNGLVLMFLPIWMSAVQENPTSSKRFPTISFRVMFNISHIRKKRNLEVLWRDIKILSQNFFLYFIINTSSLRALKHVNQLCQRNRVIGHYTWYFLTELWGE